MKKTTIVLSILLAIAICLTVSGTWAADVRGVTKDEIKLACLVDFSGPGKFAGPPLALGAETYIKYINDQGGVHGRKIKLIVEDNGILPNTTLAATKKVIFKDEIFAIGFNLGSSGSSAIIPLCEENKVVMMPHGANKRFYNPGNKWVFVPYSTQFNMGSRAVEFALEQNPKARIGIIYQDDDFGRDGLEGARAAAKFMKTKLVKEAPYKIGTIDLSPQMRMMKEANVDWILAWTYIPQSGSILKEKRTMNWDVNVIGNNTTAYRLIFPPLGELSDGYMAVTPYVPWEDTPQRTQDILKKYGVLDKVATSPFPAPMFFGSWAYFAAMVEGLKQAGPNLTPETLIKGLEKVNNLDVGGMCPNITFTPKRHAGYFSSLVVKADAKNKRFVTISPIKEPKTPQD
ncbi:MAG: ABC transporter substrate-binding protein [Desulfobacterales bacterium]|jgi:branched-chain amino acid transport system substrate-binding protein